jgi:hypothetical protein
MPVHVPGDPPTRGVAAKNLEESVRGTLADRDGHDVARLVAGGWGRARSERIGCWAHLCAVMSATVVAEVVRQVVRQVVHSHTVADALLRRATDPRPWGLGSEWSTGRRTDRWRAPTSPPATPLRATTTATTVLVEACRNPCQKAGCVRRFQDCCAPPLASGDREPLRLGAAARGSKIQGVQVDTGGRRRVHGGPPWAAGPGQIAGVRRCRTSRRAK